MKSRKTLRFALDAPCGRGIATIHRRAHRVMPPTVMSPSYARAPPCQRFELSIESVLDGFVRAARVRHLSKHTIRCYRAWIVAFLRFCREGGRWRHPRELGGADVGPSSRLAVERRFSASSQNQAACAVVFLFERVLGDELGEDRLGRFKAVRAKRRLWNHKKLTRGRGPLRRRVIPHCPVAALLETRVGPYSLALLSIRARRPRKRRPARRPTRTPSACRRRRRPTRRSTSPTHRVTRRQSGRPSNRDAFS